jgi:thiol-disulfide isomerase/thioredoxin
MIPLKYALLIVAVLIILYILYNFNKKSDSKLEKNLNESIHEETKHIDVETTDTKITKKIGVYYTEWCGYSKQFLKQLETGLSDELKHNNVEVILVDCEKNKDVCNAMGVEGFPTLILHTSNGNKVYNGQRDNKSIINFALNN